MSSRYFTLALVAAGTIAIVAVAARAADPSKGIIHGTITKADGAAAAGCKVDLYSAAPADPGGGKSRVPKPVATVKADDKGHYTLEDIPPGVYRYIAGVPMKEGAIGNVMVKAGEKVTLNLKLKARRIY